MTRTSLAALRRLRMSDETWQLARRRMRLWITPPGEEPQRPYLVLCRSLQGPVLLSDISPNYPSVDGMLSALVEGMRAPIEGAGSPRRPRRIQLEEAELVQGLATALQVLDIVCEQAPLPQLELTLLNLETHLRGRNRIAGLLASPGMTADQVAGFFSAAAFYYRQAPWRWLSDSQPVAVRYPQTGRRRYAVLLGNAGIEYGLAAYSSWSVLQAVYEGRRPESVGRGVKGLAVMYDEITGFPFDDLDDLEAHGWGVAGDQAYPVPAVLPSKDTLQRPGVRELGWLEAVLRAIPVFVREHVLTSDGGLRPAAATVEVPVTSGMALVGLHFPAPPGRTSQPIRPRRRPRP